MNNAHYLCQNKGVPCQYANSNGYKTKTSFYQFCIRYVRWAFLAEYAKKKKELDFINTLYNSANCTAVGMAVSPKKRQGGRNEQTP